MTKLASHAVNACEDGPLGNLYSDVACVCVAIEGVEAALARVVTEEESV